MNEMNDLPHRFADHCPHAGMDKACPSCRRAFGEVYRLAHIDFQGQMQASIDASIREVQANAWDEGRASAGIMLPTKPPHTGRTRPMSEYTEEDFKNAMFAVLPKYGLRAHKSAGNSYWQRDGINRATNAEMAEAGWRPIHEHNPHATGTPEEEVQNLRDANAGLKMRVEYLNGELVLWQERASQAEAHARKAEAAPLTLDSAVREMQEKAWDECARSAGDMASPLMDQNPYREGL